MAKSCVRLRVTLWILNDCVGFSDVSGTSTTSKDWPWLRINRQTETWLTQEEASPHTLAWSNLHKSLLRLICDYSPDQTQRWQCEQAYIWCCCERRIIISQYSTVVWCGGDIFSGGTVYDVIKKESCVHANTDTHAFKKVCYLANMETVAIVKIDKFNNNVSFS